MGNTDAVAEFKRGVDLLRNGYTANAFECFRSAAEAEQENPYYLSFLGLSVARAHKKWAAALQLCEAALRLKRDEPQLYLNLAEVYVSASQREEAIEVLDMALTRFGYNPRIKRERNNLGRRGNRVLPFLSRQHFLNRTLGQLRHQASRRLRGTPKAGSR
jgi:predicted Zn-dependent protease